MDVIPVQETDTKVPSSFATPSPKAQSWGAMISIIVIVLMIVIGAFYSWGKRVSETNIPADALITPQ